MQLSHFLKKLREDGLEYYKKYYAFYVGKVLSIDDPEQIGRIEVSLPEISGSQSTGFAYPITLSTGFVNLPKKDDFVIIVFKNGDVRFPHYLGTWWGKGEFPEKAKESYGKIYLWQSPNGSYILINDDEEVLELNGKTYKAVKGDTLKTEIDKLNAQMDAIRQAVQNWVVVPNDGGAAFKTLLSSLFLTKPQSDFSDILSDKVKLD